jgi:tryptophan-rich sensory protein
MSRGVVAVGTVVVVAVYAIGAGVWSSSDPGWYAALAKPAWQPPDWVFGVMWPYNFAALLVVGLVLATSRPASASVPWLAVLVVSVVFALGWAYLFYAPHALTAAAVCLGLAAVLTWVLVVLAARELPWTGLVLLPYALWVSVATALAVAYSRGAA